MHESPKSNRSVPSRSNAPRWNEKMIFTSTPHEEKNNSTYTPIIDPLPHKEKSSGLFSPAGASSYPTQSEWKENILSLTTYTPSK